MTAADREDELAALLAAATIEIEQLRADLRGTRAAVLTLSGALTAARARLRDRGQQ